MQAGAPPPIISDPRPTRPDSHALPIVLAIAALGGGFLLLAGAVAGGFYIARQSQAGSRPPAEGFGQVVRQQDLGDGWARYSFPDMKLRADLPNQPVPAISESWGAAAPSIYTNWSRYEVQSTGNLNIMRVWYRPGVRFAMDDHVQSELDEAVAWKGKEVRSARRLRTLKGHPVYTMEFRYELDGRAGIRQVGGILLKDSTIAVASDYWLDNREVGKAEFDRVMGSITLKP
jgi:hypothetical protein